MEDRTKPVDLYLQKYTETLVNDLDSIREIAKLLDSVNVINNWFSNDFKTFLENFLKLGYIDKKNLKLPVDKNDMENRTPDVWKDDIPHESVKYVTELKKIVVQDFVVNEYNFCV